MSLFAGLYKQCRGENRMQSPPPPPELAHMVVQDTSREEKKKKQKQEREDRKKKEEEAKRLKTTKAGRIPFNLEKVAMDVRILTY